MISYKYWKLLQESLDDTVNLGVKSPTNLGFMSEAPQLFGMLGKKPDGPGGPMGKPGMAPPDMGGDEGGEDDMGAPDDMGGEDHPDDDEDLGDEDHPDDDEDLGDEEGGEGDEEGGLGHDDMGDEEGGEEGGEEGPPPDMGGGKPPFGKGKPPMGKPMGPMDKPAFMKKEGKGGKCMKCGMMMDKHGGKCCSKASKKMNSEHANFLNSLAKMTGGSKFVKNSEGDWVPVSEDYLVDDSATEETSEPAPGTVGFAPQQNLGIRGSVAGTTTYQEWLSRRKK